MGGRTNARTEPTVGVRLARSLASPGGVLISLPALVVAVGLGILLVGRDATRTTSDQMARQLLTSNATSVQSDVAFALDQAGPVLERLRALADPQRPVSDVLVRIHDLIVGRPGVAFASMSFPDGEFRGAYLDGDRVAVQQSRLTSGGTDLARFSVEGGALVPLRRETTDYDPRRRGFYQVAVATGARAWTEPYTFFASHETGITCTEPVYGDGHALAAVLTVDFDVGALSKYVARPVLDHARAVVYTRSGVVLAYPPQLAAGKLAVPADDKLLRHQDLGDPAVEALFAQPPPGALALRDLDASDGRYLAAVAPIGGRRAGVALPLDWYVATVVPERTLLGPTHALERSSLYASAGALVLAVGLAIVLAWNLVRMRRQVARSRAEARTAEARARELGSYRLVARLGAGGMGEVWRAEHRLLARSAAIKLIRAEALDDGSIDEVNERFRREAQTLASMRSRHTIAIFDYGVTELGVFYYVMELLDGLDLESLIERDGPQPPARVIEILIQALASLAEAHDAGLLHRDIKPPNLFLCRAADEVDIVKLLDFGIVQTVAAPADEAPAVHRVVSEPAAQSTVGSLVTDKLTQHGAILGTPGFMAPEQILGSPIDARADLYALGCCAWWLLTGKEVFDRHSAEVGLLHQHLQSPPPRLSDQLADCPPALEAVVAACLAKDPRDRPRDARALARQLRTIAVADDQAWTRERAEAWWRGYHPAPPPPAGPATELQVIMPGRTDQRPVAATSDTAIAQTVMSTPHARGDTA